MDGFKIETTERIASQDMDALMTSIKESDSYVVINLKSNLDGEGGFTTELKTNVTKEMVKGILAFVQQNIN